MAPCSHAYSVGDGVAAPLLSHSSACPCYHHNISQCLIVSRLSHSSFCCCRSAITCAASSAAAFSLLLSCMICEYHCVCPLLLLVSSLPSHCQPPLVHWLFCCFRLSRSLSLRDSFSPRSITLRPLLSAYPVLSVYPPHCLAIFP